VQARGVADVDAQGAGVHGCSSLKGSGGQVAGLVGHADTLVAEVEPVTVRVRSLRPGSSGHMVEGSDRSPHRFVTPLRRAVCWRSRVSMTIVSPTGDRAGEDEDVAGGDVGEADGGGRAR
jgi:hypothetical protein